MKKIFNLSILLLIISNCVIAQSSGKLTQDEITRIKLTVPLITYDTIPTFDNAEGEAYFNLIIASFKENLTIPKFACTLTPNDKSIIDKYVILLNNLKQNPPDWDDLLEKQTQYFIWLDIVSHRKSKYKTKI